jgi:hypothetical protein
LPLLDKDEKKSILGVIKSIVLLKKKKTEEFVSQYNNDIDAAMTRINNGQYTTHDELEKEMDSW